MIDWNARSNAWANAILASNRLEELLTDLACNFRSTSTSETSYRGPCPVHGGDGPNCLITTHGDRLPIIWACHSEGCHRTFKPSLLGLVRGILSFQSGKPVGLTAAEKCLKAFQGGRPSGQPGPRPRSQPRPQPQLSRFSRDQVRQRLQIPSPYFLQRGFSPAVLDRHDVGHSPRQYKSIVPLYDDAGQNCIGFLARSEMPACKLCEKNHDPEWACCLGEVKWTLPSGFPRASHLYNYHTALRSPSEFILVVEGPGDVWRVEEAGHTAVALLGVDLSCQQIQLLAALKKPVLLALDNDPRGQNGMVRAHDSLGGKVPAVDMLYVPEPYKDIGEMPAEAVARWLPAA